MKACSKGVARFRGITATFCLLAYVQAAGIVPVVLALVASVEGSHAVSFSCAAERMSVVLQHDPIAGIGDVQHQHGLASGVLCLLGKSGPSPLSDHAAFFEFTRACEKSPNEPEVKAPVLLLTDGYGRALSSRYQPSCYPLISSDDSSVDGLRVLRTTVLLI